MVNRVWQHHFGKALVKTTSDFGRAGALPTHPQLLDWLAAEFIDAGWSVKKLHRLIMLSQTYRQSSRVDNERALEVDPGNNLLWRQNLRRLEAEAVRDAVLSIAGSLNLQMGGRGFFPHLGGEVLAGQSRPGLDWEVSTDAEQSRRSIYAFVRRTMAVPLLEGFDYSNTTSPLPERATTTVAPQALMLLNDDFLEQQAAAFAGRLVREVGHSPAKQIDRAYQLAVIREPTAREREIALAFLSRQSAAFAALSSRLTFRPDVATALATDYFNKLQPADFLIGPRDGWSYHRGSWAPSYEGIRVVDRQQTPFALWDRNQFKDGVVEAKLLLSSSSEFASLLIRANADGGVSRGYEIAFDPRRQRISVRRQGADPATIADEEAQIPFGTPFRVTIESIGPRIRVSVHGESRPVVDVVDEKSIANQGQIGVRTWGGSLSLDDLTVRTSSDDGDHRIVPAGAANPAQRALQSFCLLVLNLNEVVYID
jgi:Protein of unknown function (DUF1553)